MKKKQQHVVMKTAVPGKKLGPPFKSADEKMRRRPIGMLETDWRMAEALRVEMGVRSVDEVMRRLVRAAKAARKEAR